MSTTKKGNRGLFIFRRDLRVEDNTSLLALAKEVQDVIPVFIFTTTQAGKGNKYRSLNSLQFLTESLVDLNTRTGGRLCVYHTTNETAILKTLIRKHGITHIGFNLDYTPYAVKRDKRLSSFARRMGVEVIAHEDYTIVPTDEIRNGGVYSVFNAFYGRMMKMDIPKPASGRVRWAKCSSSGLSKAKKEFLGYNKDIIVHGGRKAGMVKLGRLGKFKNYAKIRDYPKHDTTLLSAYIKYGCVSMREVYWAMVKKTGKKSELVRQLIWHDFYANLMKYLPVKKTIGGGNFKGKKIRWSSGEGRFKAWCEGRTGFPMVDAGMRQLNTVGWMHNRVRLIVSNFLSLVLHIDWRKGERYFATRLVDYDVSSNNGNWQWSTGVGTDRTGYLRIYNPFSQSEKLDKDCTYIKRWIPELKNTHPRDIHKWESECDRLRKEGTKYPCPIVDIGEQMKKSKKMYK
jgi:deoxyribodipyrimidine photo-lyase